MKDYYSDNAIRTDNIITLKYCNHPKCASDFLRLVKEVLRRGYSEIVIRSDAISVFPNACVPIAGIIDYYTQNGVNFVHDINPDSYLYKCGFMAPFKKSRKELQSEQFPFDKIFYYEDSGQVADITQTSLDKGTQRKTTENGAAKPYTMHRLTGHRRCFCMQTAFSLCADMGQPCGVA